MRVLVTGGAGFIGSVTVARLLEAGHEVEVLDDLRTGHAEAVPGAVVLHELALDDPAVSALVAGGRFDACVHFAASIEAGESMVRPEAFFRNNTAAALVLLEHLVTAGVGRFVLSSTAAVYGDPEHVPVDEAAALVPVNAYGATKLAVEQALDWIGRLRGLRWAALRYFNAAGAYGVLRERHDPESHLIPLMLQVARGERERILVFGDDYPTPDGTCVRDYVHVADLADAHVAALEALGERERIICNLGTGTGHSVAELLEVTRRVTGHPIPAEVVDRRPGDPAVLVAAADRAAELLGWRAVRGLTEIVTDAWSGGVPP